MQALTIARVGRGEEGGAVGLGLETAGLGGAALGVVTLAAAAVRGVVAAWKGRKETKGESIGAGEFIAGLRFAIMAGEVDLATARSAGAVVLPGRFSTGSFAVDARVL